MCGVCSLGFGVWGLWVEDLGITDGGWGFEVCGLLFGLCVLWFGV